MDTHEKLERAATKFANTVAKTIAAQVERAVALERDRLDSDVAGLTRAIDALTERLERLERVHEHDEFAHVHSIRAPDGAA